MKSGKITAFLTSFVLCAGCAYPMAADAVTLGDVDYSGAVDAADASEILRIYSDISTGSGSYSSDILTIADVDKNGNTDASDATFVLSYYAYNSTGHSLSIEKFVDQNDKSKKLSIEKQCEVYADQVGALINEARTSLGLKPVKIAPCLMDVSEIRAKELVTLFSHRRPNGTGVAALIDEKGIYNYGYGENICAGTCTPLSTFTEWKNSTDGHWEIMTKPAYTHIGIGVVYDPNSEYGWYWQISLIINYGSFEGEYYP